jgi:hypothetical protein
VLSAEHPSEVAGLGIANLCRDLLDGQVRSLQQLAGALDATSHQPRMRRQTRAHLECAAEVLARKADEGGETGEPRVGGKVGLKSVADPTDLPRGQAPLRQYRSAVGTFHVAHAQQRAHQLQSPA